MVAASVQHVNLIPTSGFMDLLFHKTYLIINIFGFFGGEGYKVTLAGLIVLVIIAAAAAAIAERLTGQKPGASIVTPLLLALLGAYIFTIYVKLPFDLVIETVPVVAALLGAIVFGVFYVLIRKQGGSSKKA
jgi:drug/metabolite transporter (DMT)-like permease